MQSWLRHSAPRLFFKRHHSTKLVDVGLWDVFGEYFGEAVRMTHSGLELMHQSGGLPWWSCIVLGAVTVRVALLPIRISAVVHQSRAKQASIDLSNRLPEVKRRVQGLLKAERVPAEAHSAFVRAELTREWLQAMRVRGTNPLRSVLPIMLNLPLFSTMTAALRRMSAYPWPFGEILQGETMVSGWDVGGVLFFVNLGVPNLALTTLVVLSNVATIEWIFRDPILRGRPRGRLLRWLMHGLNGVSFYLLSLVPSAINLFVLCNNGLTVLEGMFLQSQFIQRRFKL